MSADVTFSIGEVAAMLGMNAATIRAWERRYGVVSPDRAAQTRYRRYTMEDIERLHLAKTLARSGRRSVRLAVLASQGVVAREPSSSAGAAAEQGLAVGDEIWRVAADLSPALELFVGRDGRIVDANVAVARAFNALRQKLPGRRFADLVDPHDREKAVLLYRGASVRRTGWELNLQTSPPTLQAFDSWPVVVDGRPLVFIRGVDRSGVDVE